MKRTSFAGMDCSIARSLEVVGEWWTMLILREAFNGVRRFDDFQVRLGIARNVLAARLQRLVDNGIFERRLYQERPERYEYRLTEKGRDLYPVLMSLLHWGDKWVSDEAGPPITLTHEPCGHEPGPVMTCQHCCALLNPREVTVQRRADLRETRKATVWPNR